VGVALSFIIRMEVGHLGMFIGREQLYNTVITAHALVIIFFMTMPMLVGGFGN